MMSLGVVGYGKIAADQHVPAIRRSAYFYLHSTAGPAGGLSGVRHFSDIDSMLAVDDAPEAVAICTPPQMRYGIARTALTAGKHVLLEKPPCVTLAEIEDLRTLAERTRCSLLCAWHSRFAPAIRPARAWLAERRLRRMRIEWYEDVRDWHPGQAWIWQAGGFGVFDPGINALSIAATIVPGGLFLRDALLEIPENCATPAVVELVLSDGGAAEIEASFDFLRAGPPHWTIEAQAGGGHLRLSEGGECLELDGKAVRLDVRDEYAGVYERFAEIIAAAVSDADVTPLRLVVDALRCGRAQRSPALDASYGI
jgi:D-galactose 1-dehydrogenase